jgi:hypothetical protein
MSKDSIALINGHEYKYRYNPETKGMDYLGPVGEAPALTQEEFLRVMAEKEIKVEWPKDYPKERTWVTSRVGLAHTRSGKFLSGSATDEDMYGHDWEENPIKYMPSREGGAKLRESLPDWSKEDHIAAYQFYRYRANVSMRFITDALLTRVGVEKLGRPFLPSHKEGEYGHERVGWGQEDEVPEVIHGNTQYHIQDVAKMKIASHLHWYAAGFEEDVSKLEDQEFEELWFHNIPYKSG